MDRTRGRGSRGIHSDPEYLAAKVEELRADVEALQKSVDVLLEDNVRKATYIKVFTWCGGAVIALVGWLIDHLSMWRM